MAGDTGKQTVKHNHAQRARSITGWTRIVAAIPALGSFIASIIIAVGALIATVSTTVHYLPELIESPAANGENVHLLLDLSISYIEYTDMFLLAVALYIIALGLVRLFISDRIPTPQWLDFHDFDDLKERLISVICVMMGVFFLGEVLQGNSGIEMLELAFSIGIVIVALSYFVRHVIKH